MNYQYKDAPTLDELLRTAESVEVRAVWERSNCLNLLERVCQELKKIKANPNERFSREVRRMVTESAPYSPKLFMTQYGKWMNKHDFERWEREPHKQAPGETTGGLIDHLQSERVRNEARMFEYGDLLSQVFEQVKAVRDQPDLTFPRSLAHDVVEGPIPVSGAFYQAFEKWLNNHYASKAEEAL